MRRQIVTIGGCGTWSLIHGWLYPFLDKNPDPLCTWNKTFNWNVHTRISKNWPIDKILYIIRDPVEAYMSYDRRGFNSIPYCHIQHMGGNLDYMRQKQSWTLKNLAKGRIEPYGIYEHMKSWIENSNLTRMIVKYEFLENNINNIAKFFNINTNNWKFKKSNSSKNACIYTLSLSGLLKNALKYYDSLTSMQIIQGD